MPPARGVDRGTVQKQTLLAALMISLAALVMVGIFFTIQQTIQRSRDLDAMETSRSYCESAISDFMDASDKMTGEVRQFSLSGDRSHLEAFWNVVDVAQSRDVAVEKLLHSELTVQETSHMLRAKEVSDTLLAGETWAMRMLCEGYGLDLSGVPQEVRDYTLSSSDEALGPSEKISSAQAFLFGSSYEDSKQAIRDAVETFREDLSSRLEANSLASLQVGENAGTFAVVGMVVLLAALVASMLVYLRAMNAKNRELSEALISARAASIAKGSFTSRMSHEIRTPLNAVMGFMALADQEDDPSRRGDYMRKARIAANSLLLIVNDVLNLSAIENGTVKLACDPFSIREVLGRLETVYSSQAQSKGVTLVFSDEGITDDVVLGDRLRINQVLTNLLSNALKFTPSGGTVECSVGQADDGHEGAERRVATTFTVTDTGIGMSPEFQRKVFEPYEQADASISQKYGGTGLGLAIVRNMVELMGGTVSVSSERGEGSAFTVALPYRVATPEQAASLAAQPDDVPAPIGSGSPLAGVSILLAEDNLMNREIAQSILGRNGAEVTCASDGEEVVEVFASAPAGTFDVILMDIQMPKATGYEAAGRIRALDRADAAEIPIVAMTANAFDEDVRKALEAGMNSHIAKPLDVPVMIETIRRHCPQKAGPQP
ncbi:MAG: ATP-binding protein [Atopobiaceae bacterium]|jgi:signal transduction histidine kinase/CheY-like chemotaxis protein|nr:ATP-binding protein [Atopobiaceae bacterium]